MAGRGQHAADQEDREVFRGRPVLGIPGAGNARPDLLTVGRFRGRSWGAPVLETSPQFSPM